MIKKKGIARKTFIFTSCLIALVVVISFAILSFVLPDYYFYSKNNRLQSNTEILRQNLLEAASEAECAQLISMFAANNNADVISFDDGDMILPDLSSPFILIDGGTRKFTVKIMQRHDSEQPGVSLSIAQENESELPTIKNNEVFFYNAAGVTENRTAVIFLKEIENGVIDHITVTGNMQPIDEARDVIISLMPYLLVIDIIIALIAAYFYVRQLTKPILAISDAASEMRKLTPGVWSGIRTSDEIGTLSQNLDEMYESLRAHMEGLRQEMERVNQLEKSKTDFMRAASHELKTPLTALNGIVEGMIDHVGVYKDKEKYLRESKILIDNLSKLVNEILGVSKLETIEDAMTLKPVEIFDVLSSIIQGYRFIAEEKDLSLNIETFHYICDTDEKLMRSALSNIILNALKYSAEGGEIHISFAPAPWVSSPKCEPSGLYLERPAPPETGWVLSIENPCENIPEEELPKLFEPFYTTNYSRNRSKSGTGLGLYIVRKNLGRLQLPYKIENTPDGIKFSIMFIKNTH